MSTKSVTSDTVRQLLRGRYDAGDGLTRPNLTVYASGMELTTSLAFLDELVKIAVSVQQLQGLARRMPILRTKVRGGGMVDASMMRGDLKQLFGRAGLSTVAKPKQVKRIADYHLKQLPDELHDVVKDQVALGMPFSRQAGGTIVSPRGGAAGQFQGIAGEVLPTKGMSGEGKKALNLVGIAHEAAERTTPQAALAPFGGHMSPDVLVREHNMLSTLSGKGAGEARKYMRDLRDMSGEADAIRESFQKRFGDRGAEFLQEGRKIPKAMRKRFGEYASSGQMLQELVP